MRYREGELQPDPDYPYTESMHHMLTASVVLSIVIGFILLWLGRHGRVLWLSVWSGGLIVFGCVYLAVTQLQLI